MRIKSSTQIFLLAVLVLHSAISAARADIESQSGTNPIMYGWVGNAQLSDLSPAVSRPLYDTLMKQNLEKAGSGFQQELVLHPNSLPAFVGLMQAQPSLWPAAAARLKMRIARQKSVHQELDPEDLFKLGTILYYQWGQQPTPPADFQTLAEAQTLLAMAWQKDQSPIVGFMFGETLNATVYSHSPLVKGWSLESIDLRLMKQLAGHTVSSEYIVAKQEGWNVEVPALSLVPAQNLRPLLAVVASLRSISGGRTGRLIMVAGKPTMIDNPVPASQIAQEHYLKKWYDVLAEATKS